MSLKKIRQAQATVKTPPKTTRVDSWSNILTGLGDSTRDKSTALLMNLTNLSQEQAEIIWRGDDMAGRIIEKLPDEMTREGFELEIEGSAGKDLAEELMDAHDDLGTSQLLYTALTYARAFGGGAILLGVDDGQFDKSMPLNEDNIRSFDWMCTLTARECVPFLWYDEPGPHYGEPQVYQVVFETPTLNKQPTFFVHESRLIPFTGTLVSRQHRFRTYNRWGDSVLSRVLRTVQQFQTAHDSTAVLMDDFAQAVFKMKGLADMLASEDPNDPQRLRNRVQAVNYSRSNINAVLLDADGEEFERKSTAVTGLPDLLDKFSLRLSAAAEMPVSLLMGQAPAGLNATGDSDIRFWYDRVKSRQVHQLTKPINRITSLKAKALGLQLDAPEETTEQEKKRQKGKQWSVRFRPLWQLTDTERATLEKTVAEKDQIYIQSGVLTPEEVALSRFGGDSWSMTTTLQDEDRQAMAVSKAQNEAEALKVMNQAQAESAPPEKSPGKSDS